MKRLLTICSLLPLAVGCDISDSDDGATVDSSIASCECPAPQASAVSFDNSETAVLAATDVQGAIDELSTRPPSFADRVYVVREERTSANNGNVIFRLSAQCEEEADEVVAIGGGCQASGTFSDISLFSSALGENRNHICDWRKPGDLAVTAEAYVVCLRLQ